MDSVFQFVSFFHYRKVPGLFRNKPEQQQNLEAQMCVKPCKYHYFCMKHRFVGKEGGHLYTYDQWIFQVLVIGGGEYINT